MDQSQQTNSIRDALRKIRQETRQTRSLETLRQSFEQLQTLRRQSVDDFDLQVMIGDIHQEIVDRARYLRGDAPTPQAPKEDHSVIFQPKPKEVTRPLQSELPLAEAVISAPATSDAKTEIPPPAEPLAAPKLPAPAEPSDAAVIPPEVTRIDASSWKTVVWLTAFLCLIVLAVFFYLIQAARKLNMPENSAQTEQPAKAASVSATNGISMTPTLRLYTDLTAGTVTMDNEPARPVADGVELIMDNLPAGQHTVKVSGTGGSSSFQFDVEGKNAPKIVGTPQANNALTVLVSSQDGHGQLMTSGGPSQILLDGKAAGQTSDGGLALAELGSIDHDFQVVHDRDKQNFVMTYTPAPVLTAYVKSDPNTGIIQIVTGEDAADVFVDNVLLHKKTDHGQVRISIRTGRYSVRVHKDGFVDPPEQSVEVNKADVTQVRFEMTPGAGGALATLLIRGAQPGTTAYMDREFVAAVGPDGSAKISDVKPGDHTIELRHDLAAAKRVQRTFHSGETITLTGAEVTLEKNAADGSKAGSGVVVVPSGDNAKPANPAAGTENQLDGAHVQRGGGFVPYGTPNSSGHYSFRTQGHVGGLLKKSKLQWYAGYQDPQNYILFSLDGKHAEVREMRNGKSILWSRVACTVDSENWVQVDLTVKPGMVSARVKTDAEGWKDIGSVSSFGRDFTQNKVGFYIPPNDEVAVSNFRFGNM